MAQSHQAKAKVAACLRLIFNNAVCLSTYVQSPALIETFMNVQALHEFVRLQL